MNTIPPVVIVGQGLAGTTLAWALKWRGLPFVIYDCPERPAASQVAAGLVTPVTGQALRVRPGFIEQLARCRSLYQRIEGQTGTRFWFEQPALRLLNTAKDVDKAAQVAREAPQHLALGAGVPDGLGDTLAVATMPHAARLDVGAYLNASRHTFEQMTCFKAAHIDPASVQVSPTSAHLRGIDFCAHAVVWCGGALDVHNAWLPERALNPARGEMIRVALDGVRTKNTLHRAGKWLRPFDKHTYQFGATYDHDDPRPVTTIAAGTALLTELTSWLRHPPELLEQTAGVRPVSRSRQPLVGPHPVHERVLYLNGLGSHGVLSAPACAERVADLIEALPRCA
ncbi:MAG: FAD-binding oxidoreductase [Pseudomonadota bacterium]